MRIEKDKNGEDITVTWALNPRGTELLAWGGSGYIFYWPGNTTEVMKLPTTDPSSIEDIEIEKRIYNRLGSHPNIVPCLRVTETGPVPVCAEHIVLKRAEHGTIRQYFQDGGTATVDERIKWCQDIAKAVQHVHSHDIRHGDIGGRNVLLDSSRSVLLCDFAGSGIDGKPPRVRAEEGFKHPVLEENRNGTMRSELHALGSTIYEIITFKRATLRTSGLDGRLDSREKLSRGCRRSCRGLDGPTLAAKGNLSGRLEGQAWGYYFKVLERSIQLRRRGCTKHSK
jgi:serine/threonine protein kinase